MSKNLLLILGILGIWFLVIRNTKSDEKGEKKDETKKEKKDETKEEKKDETKEEKKDVKESVDLAMTKSYTL